MRTCLIRRNLFFLMLFFSGYLQAAGWRSFSNDHYVGGDKIVVTIQVIPETSVSWAVEESPPPGWLVSGYEDSGGFFASDGKLKWGLFLSSAPISLSYVVSPGTNSVGAKEFSGLLSEDGISEVIGGDTFLNRPSRITETFYPAKGEVLVIPRQLRSTGVSIYTRQGVFIKDMTVDGYDYVWNGRNASDVLVRAGLYVAREQGGGFVQDVVVLR